MARYTTNSRQQSNDLLNCRNWPRADRRVRRVRLAKRTFKLLPTSAVREESHRVLRQAKRAVPRTQHGTACPDSASPDKGMCSRRRGERNGANISNELTVLFPMKPLEHVTLLLTSCPWMPG